MEICYPVKGFGWRIASKWPMSSQTGIPSCIPSPSGHGATMMPFRMRKQQSLMQSHAAFDFRLSPSLGWEQFLFILRSSSERRESSTPAVVALTEQVCATAQEEMQVLLVEATMSTRWPSTVQLTRCSCHMYRPQRSRLRSKH